MFFYALCGKSAKKKSPQRDDVFLQIMKKLLLKIFKATDAYFFNSLILAALPCLPLR